MKPEMDHLRCSESLPALLAGRLDEDDRALVKAHLAGCPDCSAELSALEMIGLLVDPSPLTDLERAALHRAVLEGAPEDATQKVLRPGSRRSWGARLYPALGAAAALILISSFFVFNNSGDDESPSSAGADNDTRIFDSGGEGGAADGAAAPEAPAAVWAGNVGELTDKQLQKLGKSTFTFGLVQRSSATMAAEAAPEAGAAADGAGAAKESSGETSLEQDAGDSAFTGDPALKAVFDIESQAPAKLGPQIEDCVNKVVGGLPDKAIVPVYASSGIYRDQKVLFLGFLFQEEVESGFDRYTIWAFPINSCDIPLQAMFGNL